MKTTTKGNDPAKQEALGQTTGMKADTSIFDKWTILQALMAPKSSNFAPHKGEGQEVDLDHAQLCINFYKSEIGKHGFTNGQTDKVDPRILSLRRVTYYEEFGGTGLIDWMTTTAEQLNKNNIANFEHLGLQLQFGIYTDEFLEIYFSEKINPEYDRRIKEQKRDRITIFLVFVDYRQNGSGQLITSAQLPKIKAYELGGIEP